ncbi:MAG: hypothetical protein KAH67_06545 [Flavobacteriaceae bacterium]|nr:hypothetical protein [Flavobacteriaceae bacterium]
MFAQIDNSEVIKTDAFIFQPEEKSTDIQKSFNSVDKGESITLFGTLNDISSNFPKYEVINNKPRKMQDNLPVEKDVLVKKFWNGQDVSKVKIKTKLELGKLETNTKKIRIECRDHSYVDGDRVRLYLNEKVIRSNIILQGGFYMIDIDLKEGFNRIDIEALNQGTSGPNTAEFRVFDGNGNLLASNEWNILTGYVATLVVTKN